MPTTITVRPQARRRLQQEGGLDHASAEADRPQNPDLLTALDGRPGADDAERRDAHDEAEP